LLFSAPESWVVSEALKNDETKGRIGEIFGKAYAGDSIVAICAGLLAGKMEAFRGVTGPFELSAGVLALAGVAVATIWGENTGGDADDNGEKLTIRDAIDVVKADEKIYLVGCIQALFEGEHRELKQRCESTASIKINVTDTFCR